VDPFQMNFEVRKYPVRQ